VLPANIQIIPDQWDFFMTAAGASIAINQINIRASSITNKENSQTIILNSLFLKSKDLVRALEDCSKFYRERKDEYLSAGLDEEAVIQILAGLWVAWNCLGRRPEGEHEQVFVQALGRALWDVCSECTSG
jgi:hypothetical protein